VHVVRRGICEQVKSRYEQFAPRAQQIAKGTTRIELSANVERDRKTILGHRRAE